MFVTITLVRHGETEDNHKLLLSSNTDVGINSNGQRQGELLGHVLKDIKFNKVFTSKLRRTRETATAILSRNEHSKIPESEFNLEEMLRERSFGEWEGMSRAEGFQKIKEMGEDPNLFTPTGGETIKQLRERTFAFLEMEIFAKIDSGELSGQNILIVTHGMLIFQFLMEILKMDQEFELEGFTELKLKLDNTDRTTFQVHAIKDDKRRKIKFTTVQDSSHLEGF